MAQARFHRTALIAAAAALTLAASAPSFAAGEFLDIELPSMRTPIEGTGAPLTRAQVQEELRLAREAGTLSTGGELGDTDTVLAARAQFELAAMSAPAEQTAIAAVATAPVTREQVQADLQQAREAGTLSMSGELADTDAVLAARDNYNTAQADSINAVYAAQAAYQAALAQAELDLQQAEAERMQAMAPSSDPDNNISLEFVGSESE